MPDFLIIGAQRSGTTSLYRYLCAHPAVAPAVLNKGIHYFDTNYGRGPDWYRSHFPSDPYKAMRRRRTGMTRILTGEGSPYYVYHPLAPQRIADTLPEARFVLMLRDPVGRAYSHYQHEVARGFEDLSFEEALQREDERLAGEEARMDADPGYLSFEHQHYSYIARGLYADQIGRWHALIDPGRLLVVDSSAFFAGPEAGFHEVLGFLELPKVSLPAYRQMNAHSYQKMSGAARELLTERYREPNRDLNDLLGRSFPWSREDAR